MCSPLTSSLPRPSPVSEPQPMTEPARSTPCWFLGATRESIRPRSSATLVRRSRLRSGETPANALLVSTAWAKPTRPPHLPFDSILYPSRSSAPEPLSSEMASYPPDSACSAPPLSLPASPNHRHVLKQSNRGRPPIKTSLLLSSLFA